MLRKLFPLLAITFVDIFGFSLIFPLLPFYAERFGASPFMIGSMIAVSSVCGLISSPYIGALSDRIGRRNMLLLTQAATALSYLMLAHANNLTVLFIARAVEGFSIGGLGVTQAYVADCTTPQQRERAYSLLAMAHGTASIMGPAICVALLPFGNAFPFTTASIVALGTVIFTYFFLGESHTPSTVPLSLTRSIARALSHKELRRLLFIYLCFMNGFTMWISSLGMIVQRLVGFTSSQASLLYGYSAVIGVAVQALLAAHLLRFMNLRTTLFTGLLCAFFAYCGIGFMTLPAAVFVVVCLWSVGSALVRPTLNTLFSDCAEGNERGVVMGAANAVFNFSFCIGPLIAATVFTYHTTYIGILPAGLILLALAFLWKSTWTANAG